jgi:RNA polymerase sigma-70 factor (ECF subfamily)
MDEQRLLAVLRGEDPVAARELIRASGERLLRSAFLLCGREADAQDLVQETFLQAIRSVHRFRGESSIYTWLHGILLNLARKLYRSRDRLVNDEELARTAAGYTEEAPSQLDVEKSTSLLMQALGSLSEAHREVLVLRYFEGMKLRAIAEHLDVSAGTIKSRLHYALEEMQQLLPGELNLFGETSTDVMAKPR